MELFGITFVGLNSENLRKLVLTVTLILVLALVRFVAGWLSDRILKAHPNEKVRFWTWQTISLASAVLLVLGLVSIWVDDPGNLTTAGGLVAGGLAFALQKVITSFAGYLVILRGRNFSIGDRIAIGGVRGEVLALGFMQTTLMEIGLSPGEQADAPSVWIRSRSFTGRIVTVTNDKIFDTPVYNYTHEFPFLWEEMRLGIAFRDDRRRAEEIMLEVGRRYALPIAELGEPAIEKLRRHYTQLTANVEPTVYMRITDNWVELTLRFLVKAAGSREMKDKMSREIMAAFDEAGIGIASTTYEIVGLPPLRIENAQALAPAKP